MNPRAPLPPPMRSQSETGPPNLDPPDRGDGLPVENVELNVILPGGERHVARVHGSKPLMDLLVVLCGRYRLSPAAHTLEMLSRDDASPLPYKPHTPLGSLCAGTALIKPRPASDDRLKKPMQPVVPQVKKSHSRVDPCTGSRKACFKVEPVCCTQELSHGLHDNRDLPAKKTKGLFSFLWPKKKKTSMPGTPLMVQQQHQPSGSGSGDGRKRRAPSAPVSPTNALATIPEDEEPNKDNVPSVSPGSQESAFEQSSPEQPRLAPEPRRRRSQSPPAPLASPSSETAAATELPPPSPPPRSTPEQASAALPQPGSPPPVQLRRRSSSTETTLNEGGGMGSDSNVTKQQCVPEATPHGLEQGPTAKSDTQKTSCGASQQAQDFADNMVQECSSDLEQANTDAAATTALDELIAELEMGLMGAKVCEDHPR